MQHQMRLTIAYSKIKKQNLVLINNATHQRETLSERPIRHAPSYLASRFTRYHKTRTGLCSAQDNTRLSVPKFRRKALQSAADKSFSLAAPLGSLDHLTASIRTANLVERVCKTREEEDEEEEANTITFRLNCIVIA